jgi:hypothetical protein
MIDLRSPNLAQELFVGARGVFRLTLFQGGDEILPWGYHGAIRDPLPEAVEGFFFPCEE